MIKAPEKSNLFSKIVQFVQGKFSPNQAKIYWNNQVFLANLKENTIQPLPGDHSPSFFVAGLDSIVQEFIKLAIFSVEKNEKVIVIFEGRDAAQARAHIDPKALRLRLVSRRLEARVGHRHLHEHADGLAQVDAVEA